MAVPYTFGSATTSIPLSQLDSNFATTITLGNTAIQLGNTVTTLNNMTLANVTISSGTSNVSSTSIVNGTSNVTIASSGGAIAMATNGATAITVNTSQNVGIGTTVPDCKLTINKNSSAPATITGNLYLNIVGANSDSPKLNFDAYANLPTITMRRANGTQASPSALVSGDQILNFAVFGYGATSYTTTNRGFITINADENWTDSAQGTRMSFATATAGAATAAAERMRIDSSGNVGIGTSSPSYKLSVAGSTVGEIAIQAINASSGNTGYRMANSLRSWAMFVNDADSGALRFYDYTAAAERMRIDSSGNLLVGLTSATSGGGVLQVSNGITFPATQSASSNANTLDDYEEGTWTPALSGTQPTTYGTRSGTYTKIGRFVYATIEFNITTLGSGSGNLNGLPFTAGQAGAGTVSYWTGLSSVFTVLTFKVNSGGSNIYLEGLAVASTTQGDNNQPWANGSRIVGTICYEV